MEKFQHVSKQLRDSVSELRSWLPNYDHGENSFPSLILSIVAALPGGENLDGVGGYDMGSILGWKEVELLGNMLNAIQSKTDVELLAAALIAENVTSSGTTVSVYEDEEQVPKKQERNLI